MLAAPERADELLPALSAYGLPLGDAFQMRDDVLGAFGDERRHRQAGGRRPARGQAHAAARAGRPQRHPAQREVLDLVGHPGIDDDDVARIQQVIVDTGALAELEAHITELTARGGRGARRRPDRRATAKHELVAAGRLRELEDTS